MTTTLTHTRPTQARPLIGLTILGVEDSRFACDALRLMCLRSGARFRRADCLRSARRHLQVYRPSVVIVDLGLPDGNGAELIADLAHHTPQIETILATSGAPEAAETALDAGAQGFFPKPITSVALFQQTILRHMPDPQRQTGPRLVSDDCVTPDRMAFHDDLSHVAALLTPDSDAATLRYAAQFLGSIARSARDSALFSAAERLTLAIASPSQTPATVGQVFATVEARLADRVAL